MQKSAVHHESDLSIESAVKYTGEMIKDETELKT